MSRVLYIHGFASSGQSWKAQALEDYMVSQGMEPPLHPTVPVEPLRAIDVLSELIQKFNVELVIGSSLGGFYALSLYDRFAKQTVLLNPSLRPWITLSGYTGPVKRHYSGDFFYWSEKHVKELEQLGKVMDYEKFDNKKLHFYLAKDDEVINHDEIPYLFPQADIKFYNDCKHTCVKFKDFLPEILQVLKD